MSMAIIPPRIIPRITLELSPMLFKPLVMAVFSAATGGLMMNTISAPMIRRPKKGYRSVGLIPSRASGNLSNSFRSPSTR